MAKKESRLSMGNLNETIVGVHVDTDGNDIHEATVCLNANDMMRMCGGTRMLKLTVGRIAGVDVMMMCHDVENSKEYSYVAPGSMRTMVIGKTQKDTVAGSCMIVGRTGTAMRSLTPDEVRRVLGTAQIYQFAKNNPVTSFCLTGFERVGSED